MKVWFDSTSRATSVGKRRKTCLVVGANPRSVESIFSPSESNMSSKTILFGVVSGWEQGIVNLSCSLEKRLEL